MVEQTKMILAKEVAGESLADPISQTSLHFIDLIRPPPHLSGIPAPPMGRSLSSSMLPTTPLSAPEEPSTLYNMCISPDPRPLPRHMGSPSCPRHKSELLIVWSSGRYIPHPTPPLPTPHLALYAPNPFKLFQPYCRALTQVGHVH